MEFVNDGPFERDRPIFRVGPREPFEVHAAGGAVDAFGLVSAPRIGERWPAIEGERVLLLGLEDRALGDEPAPGGGTAVHPLFAREQDKVHALCAGSPDSERLA